MADKSKPAVRGHITDATTAGFREMIEKANEAQQQGLTMIGIVNIGTKQLGGVFVQLPERHEANLV